MTNQRGQTLVAALAILVAMLILVPVLVMHVQRESRWSVKEQQSTMAFHLAEAGVERGYRRVTTSTATWSSVMSGNTISGYNFDIVYDDLKGGTYAIKITSTTTNTVQIIGVGRDTNRKEIRAIKAVYTSTPLTSAVYGKQGVNFSGTNNKVEWGPVVSPNTITPDTGDAHPRMYSASSIVGFDTDPVPPNTDNIQKWAYESDLAPAPNVDFDLYKSSAQNSGNSSDSDCGSYYKNSPASISISGCNDSTGRTFYIDSGVTTFELKPPANYITGNIIVINNLNFQGASGGGSPTATVPPKAWMEYGNDWSNFTSNHDTSAPSTYQGAVDADYSTPGTVTKTLSNIVVHGFLYVGGNLTLTGSGNSAVWGKAQVMGTYTATTGQFTVWYDSDVSVQTTNVITTRSSWQELINCTWTGTYPSCS